MALKRILILLLLTACSDAPLPGRPPRHVLLITVEGLRADHTSALMYHRPTTLQPVTAQQRVEGKALSVDDLAADGVLFSQAFAPSGDAGRGVLSLLAGDRGLFEFPQPMLAKSLSEGGMFTIALLNDSGSLPKEVEEGFHSCQRLKSDIEVLIEAVKWFDVHDFGNCEGVFVWIHLRGPVFPFTPGIFPDLLTKEKVDFARLYSDSATEAAMTGSLEERAAWWSQDPPKALSSLEIERLTDLYDGGIGEMSSQLWFLLDYMHFATRSDQALDEMVAVVVGVNGVELDRPGVRWGTSGEARDSSLHVPLLFRHTGGMPGRRILRSVVELCDVAPTLCAWFGRPARGGRDGRSLLPLLGASVHGEPSTPTDASSVLSSRPAVALQQDPFQLTARDERWRLVVDFERTEDGTVLIDAKSALLFDSARGPREERDVATEYPEQVQRLLGVLASTLPSTPGKNP